MRDACISASLLSFLLLIGFMSIVGASSEFPHATGIPLYSLLYCVSARSQSLGRIHLYYHTNNYKMFPNSLY